jgi:hypothetical protein
MLGRVNTFKNMTDKKKMDKEITVKADGEN